MTQRTLASSHAEFMSRRFFGSLDALRALSVVAVIWHHTAPTHTDAMPQLLARGHHGVTLFFAISGFLIVTLLLRERERTGRIDLRSFYIRRGLRIFPLYYAVTALYAFLVFLIERDTAVGREFFRNLPFFLTYTSNWFVLLEGRVIFYFAWSLAAEEQFYLLWPTIQKYFSLQQALAVVGAVIVIVALTQLLSTGGAKADSGLLHRMVIGVPLAICFGVVLAHALHLPRSFNALRWAFGQRASVLMWLAVFLGSLNWPSAPTVLIHLSATMLVGACVYREDHWLAPLFRLRGIAYVGTVSYGVYLLHMLTKNSVVKIAGALHLELSAYAVFAFTVAGSIVAAGISFRHFEARFLRLKRQYMAA